MTSSPAVYDLPVVYKAIAWRPSDRFECVLCLHMILQTLDLRNQAITSCTLVPEQGAYVICVETPVPLDLVLLHSAVHMDFLESDDEDDRGQASTCCNGT